MPSRDERLRKLDEVSKKLKDKDQMGSRGQELIDEARVMGTTSETETELQKKKKKKEGGNKEYQAMMKEVGLE